MTNKAVLEESVAGSILPLRGEEKEIFLMYFRRNVKDCWTDGNIVKDDGTLLQVESDLSSL